MENPPTPNPEPPHLFSGYAPDAGRNEVSFMKGHVSLSGYLRSYLRGAIYGKYLNTIQLLASIAPLQVM